MDENYYRGFTIEPKRDFGSTGFLINGQYVKTGYVAVRDFCNPMPGATWFLTIDEAKKGIDIFLAADGNAELFWRAYRPEGAK